jgi:hypothetical protein
MPAELVGRPRAKSKRYQAAVFARCVYLSVAYDNTEPVGAGPAVSCSNRKPPPTLFLMESVETAA